MKKFPLFGALMLIPALALLALTGCPTPNKTTPTPTTGGGNTNPAVAKTKITAPTDGTIKGVVTLTGGAFEMQEDPVIAAHNEKEICLAGGGIHTKKQDWIVGKKGGLANVVVWLAPATKEYDVKPEHKKPFEKPAVVDQPFCQYVPHVTAVYANIQPLEVKNSSKTPHNVKITPDRVNKAIDEPMSPNGKPLIYEKFKMEPTPINMACSIHTWMSGKILTFDHPYFAVTDADGNFTIANVPTGEELTVWTWHEVKGKAEVKAYKFKAGDNDLPLSVTP